MTILIRFFVCFCLLFLFHYDALADVIVLKNGDRVKVGVAWEENGEIKGTGETSLVSFPVEAVSHIEEEKRSPRGELLEDGFQFDVWTAGLSIEDVMLIAETNDIPLHRTGLISGGKRFNPEVSRKYMKTATSYYYQDHLMGRPAKVYLSVTQLSKILFSVSIHFSVTSNLSDVENEIRDVLEQKYGKPAKSGKRDLLHNQVIWRIGRSTQISLVSGFNNLRLVYKDLALERRNSEEEQKAEGEEIRATHSEDAHKF